MENQTNVTENTQEAVQKEKKKKRIIIGVVIFIVALVISGITFYAINTLRQSESGSTAGGVGYVVDPNAGAYVEQVTEETDANQGVAIPGWGSLTIPPMTTELTNMVNFYNPEANEGLYYLTFELRLPDDSEQGYEVLYSSQLIPPGQCIQSITLSRGLPAGEYDAVIHVQPYTMDEAQTPTNNADMNTTLIVK